MGQYRKAFGICLCYRWLQIENKSVFGLRRCRKSGLVNGRHACGFAKGGLSGCKRPPFGV